MFPDYTALIVAEYHRKIKDKVISQRLIHPTPGRLKEECMAVCKERFLKSDENTLRIFFEHAGDQKSYLQKIDDYEIDKFRPLVNFLKGKTDDPDYKNIELLAWLIDFKPRPFELGRVYNDPGAGPVDLEKGQQSEKKKEEQIDDTPGNDDSTNKNEKDSGKEETLPAQRNNSETEKTIETTPLSAKPTTFKIAATIITLAILALAISIFWPKPKKQQVFALTGHEACMFWTGDHFQQISCSQKLGDTLVIALDSVKLYQFKKITRPDTITRNAMGNVWYVKVNGNIEFYTADGYHPVHTELRLRPITLYIINKYIINGQPE